MQNCEYTSHNVSTTRSLEVSCAFTSSKEGHTRIEASTLTYTCTSASEQNEAKIKLLLLQTLQAF